eukprot:3796133-Rhodomonas_salina.2
MMRARCREETAPKNSAETVDVMSKPLKRCHVRRHHRLPDSASGKEADLPDSQRVWALLQSGAAEPASAPDIACLAGRERHSTFLPQPETAHASVPRATGSTTGVCQHLSSRSWPQSLGSEPETLSGSFHARRTWSTTCDVSTGHAIAGAKEGRNWYPSCSNCVHHMLSQHRTSCPSRVSVNSGAYLRPCSVRKDVFQLCSTASGSAAIATSVE